MYQINNNKFDFRPEQLFCIGKRDNNPKRGFLFISKLLGKHLVVKPQVVRATGFLLASLIYGFDNETFVNCIKDGLSPDYTRHASDSNVLVIGFCETATALGMSVASAISGSHYISSTREKIVGVPQLLTFEESHSHASTHKIFSNWIKLDEYDKVILVDDEITTGHSLLHLMRSIISHCNIRHFSILTILDWRDEGQKKDFRDFSDSYQVSVDVHALVSGQFEEKSIEVFHNDQLPQATSNLHSQSLNIFPRSLYNTENGPIAYLMDSGRFGITYPQILEIEDLASKMADQLMSKMNTVEKILVLGHGENIYIPSRVAAALETKGLDVDFRTTSRTPIYVDREIIKDALEFSDRGVTYHFYNVSETSQYDRVLMLADTPFRSMLCNNLRIYDL